MNSAIIVGIFTLAGTAVGAFSQYLLSTYAARRSLRHQAILQASLIIDHVLANQDMGGRRAPNPHEWDITTAYDAKNMISLYCRNPNKMTILFLNAMGVDKSGPWRPAQEKTAFEKGAKEEIAFFWRFWKKDYRFDENRILIRNLPGGIFPPLAVATTSPPTSGTATTPP